VDFFFFCFSVEHGETDDNGYNKSVLEVGYIPRIPHLSPEPCCGESNFR
jgi:hypothetical protein